MPTQGSDESRRRRTLGWGQTRSWASPRWVGSRSWCWCRTVDAGMGHRRVDCGPLAYLWLLVDHFGDGFPSNRNHRYHDVPGDVLAVALSSSHNEWVVGLSPHTDGSLILHFMQAAIRTAQSVPMPHNGLPTPTSEGRDPHWSRRCWPCGREAARVQVIEIDECTLYLIKQTVSIYWTSPTNPSYACIFEVSLETR